MGFWDLVMGLFWDSGILSFWAGILGYVTPLPPINYGGTGYDEGKRASNEQGGGTGRHSGTVTGRTPWFSGTLSGSPPSPLNHYGRIIGTQQVSQNMTVLGLIYIPELATHKHRKT